MAAAGGGWRARHGVLYIGTADAAGRREVRWLLSRVWPKVRAALPSARLVLAGAAQWRAEAAGIAGVSAAAEGRANGAAGGVGTVGGVGRLVDAARLVAVPALVASGVASTSFAALRRAAPLVTTPLGMRGLLTNSTPGAVAVGRTAAEFAAAIIDLHSNGTRWARQRAAAMRHAERHLGEERAQKALRRALRYVTVKTTARRAAAAAVPMPTPKPMAARRDESGGA